MARLAKRPFWTTQTHSTRTWYVRLSQELALDPSFSRLFSGDISVAQSPMRSVGWATGYALSIYGTEYKQQCPFGTGNAYGDGRAISAERRRVYRERGGREAATSVRHE